MSEPIISVSGLRGIVGESLTPPVAMSYATAFATDLPAGPVVVTNDGRASGVLLADAIRSGLCGLGRTVIDAGIAATPTTGVLVRQLKAAGGIQISASHNGPEYNGMKLFSAEGRVIPAASGENVLRRYRQGTDEPAWVSHSEIGRVQTLDDSTGEHCRLVLATVDAERIRRCRFAVLLDSNHGAGSLLGRRLLEQLGCRVTLLGGEPDGRFAHTAEPTAENLTSVCRRVVSAEADVGFCQDPDADRLAVIDEGGRCVGEEYTLALCLDHVLRRRKGPVVANCSTSRMSEDLAAKYGVAFFRSAVGEANVVDLMQFRKAVFGGEGNGGPIDPEVGYVRDSFVGMAQVLDAMAARRAKVSRLADELPRYSIRKTKVSLAAENAPAAYDALAKHFAGAAADRMDGLRLDWPDKWLLVRPSNTEPIVRIVAEAAGDDEAESLCAQAGRIIDMIS